MKADPLKRDFLREFKATAGLPGPNLALRVGRPTIGWLRVVGTRAGQQDDADLDRLSRWRNANHGAFLTEFEATPKRTSRWLSEVVAPDDSRILFMLDDPNGSTVGYMGLAFIDWDKRKVEADAIVRAEPAPKGIAREALLTLLDWARFTLGLDSVGVRVRADNPALAFYRNLGFVESRRVPLRKEALDDMHVLVEAPDEPDPPTYLVHMRLTR